MLKLTPYTGLSDSLRVDELLEVGALRLEVLWRMRRTCKCRNKNRPRHAVRAGDAAEEKWTAGSWFHERLWSEPGSWDTGGMYTVKIYARVRRVVLVEGKSERVVAQEFGIALETVYKLQHFRRRRRKRFWKDTCAPLLISGECSGRFSTTTRSWRWPRFWGRRAEEDAGCELQSHCLFKEKFGRPGKGNYKGKVEGLVGYARRNSLVPIPRVASREELNTHLRGQCGEQR